MSKKSKWIDSLIADGMSRSQAEYEYENNILPTIQEIDMETEKYDYDPKSAKKKTKKKKKDTKVASLRSSKDKKFQGHTTYKT